MLRLDANGRTVVRWGGGIAVLLAVQSMLLAGLFWLLASGAHYREAERLFGGECRRLALLGPDARARAVRDLLDADVHRDRFLALFAPDGHRLAGNVARLPQTGGGPPSAVVAVAPTELPGKTRDIARVAICPMPDGTRLLTGVDLDESERVLATIERALLIGLAPGLLLAIGFGLLAGQRAARQVEAVRHLTRRLVAGDLRDRLPVPRRPDSFGLLCANINDMLDRIELLVADMRGLGDDIAHQIRTPLTRLRARLERLPDPADAAASLDEVDKVLGIVAALLRIREIEDHARRSRFAPVDLGKLLTDACELHAPDAEERGMTLVCAVAHSAWIDGDASLLMEAVSNLIDNAMKFGPRGGAITVSLDCAGGSPRLGVADEGTGVPLAERDLVTQRFYRARRDVEGAGLGLSLVKAIADLHAMRLGFCEHASAVTLTCRAT